jgi:hypothetical protein
MVNTKTGRTRTVTYCGITYTVEPGEVNGGKQFWRVRAGEDIIAPLVYTLSKCANAIHHHAVTTGAYPAIAARCVATQTALPRRIQF